MTKVETVFKGHIVSKAFHRKNKSANTIVCPK